MSTPLESTKSGATAIATVSYTHDAMIDLILAQPGMKQGEIARYFGYTEGWVSRVMGSDAFNARLAARKTEIVDPTILATMEERLKGLAIQSIEVIQKKLEATSSPELATKTLELTTKALGMGARQPVSQQNNTFVVALPSVVPDENAWARAAQQGTKEMADRAKAARAEVIDAVIKPA